MTTLDVIALLVLALGVTAFGAWQHYKFYKVLRDPDHPDHETATEAVSMPDYDRLRFL